MLVENSTVQPRPNSAIILTLCRTFAILKKLGVEANELEGLLAQAACHTPPTLDQVAFDQLLMAAIQAKGKEKPLSTFMGQVILNMSQKNRESTHHSLPLLPSFFQTCVLDKKCEPTSGTPSQ
ncbi:hypothetical protein O181_065725 [Austropuccinia psidii MF-1]|uniref:Uncharacterized protein n=1 Tax=Austropuccinia psidii MF-1 TaxID=1389203 RepID=A0A9Q3EVM6_9BASI|nr:hypothetical protein [Austropuccinia psidii MF-1]